MRPGLPHPLGEHRQRRPRGERRSAWRRRRSRAAAEEPQRPSSGHHGAGVARVEADPAVVRVQRAGGPMDCASYACSCGYLFVALVSTSVRCPHCGSGQAW